METIKILPHHALSYFEFFYLKRDPSILHNWYNSQVMQEEAVKRVQAVLNNPQQLVQLVSGYDDWCRFCTYHRLGEDYDPEKEPCIRDGWNIPRELDYAKILGLEDFLDKSPIIAKEFLEKMKPTYEKLIAEPLYQDKNNLSKKITKSSNEVD